VSYQWALSQFRGTHTIAAQTDFELIYSNVCLIVGLVVVSTFISTLTETTAEMHEMWREMKQKDRILCDYLQEFEISLEVSARAKKILSLAYNKNILHDADTVLMQLPTDVIMDVHYEARSPALCEHVLFATLRRHFPRAFHRFCHDGVTDTLVTKYEAVFLPGDACHRSLFVWSGLVAYEPAEVNHLAHVRKRLQHNTIELCKGAIVCDVALWTSWVNRGTLHTVEDSTMFAISVDRLQAHAIAFVGVHAAAVLYARQFLELASFESDLFEPIEYDLLLQANEVEKSAGKVSYDFFLSHTQRDDASKLLATELYSALTEAGKRCWLDVKMDRCDRAAMMEGVQNSDCFIAIVTDNGVDSYFSREMCRAECAWAISSSTCIVPVVATADKHRITDFVTEGLTHNIDFSEYNFCQYDRSGPEYTKASVRTILQQAKAGGEIARAQAEANKLHRKESKDVPPTATKVAPAATKVGPAATKVQDAMDASIADAIGAVDATPFGPDPKYALGYVSTEGASEMVHNGNDVERKKEHSPCVKKKVKKRIFFKGKSTDQVELRQSETE
jgi:hypothetical protein